MISIIAPSRGRPEKSFATIQKWFGFRGRTIDIELIISLDSDDKDLERYIQLYKDSVANVIVWQNRSAIDAINTAARITKGNILIVVSDDSDCINNWDTELLKEVEGKADWILKTKDGIQDYIITMPVMDRAYYNRTGYIYHPDFLHLFCDTYMTCVADITGRKITSNLLFKHNHYSVGGAVKDDVNKKNDATWKQGEETFIRLMKQFTPEERNRIKDFSMRNWLRNHGVR